MTFISHGAGAPCDTQLKQPPQSNASSQVLQESSLRTFTPQEKSPPPAERIQRRERKGHTRAQEAPQREGQEKASGHTHTHNREWKVKQGSWRTPNRPFAQQHPATTQQGGLPVTDTRLQGSCQRTHSRRTGNTTCSNSLERRRTMSPALQATMQAVQAAKQPERTAGAHEIQPAAAGWEGERRHREVH